MAERVDFHKHGQLAIFEIGAARMEVCFNRGQIKRRNKKSSNGGAKEG